MSSVTPRLPAQERRALILAAATRAFAVGGYAGTSTDAVAKEAGVSQPYVVRMFGTKLDLFLAVYSNACERIELAFRDVLAQRPFDPASEEDRDRLGLAYIGLLTDGDFLHVLMHGFSASAVPEIGTASREGMGRIFATLRETGWSDEEVRDFIAHGMLLNVLFSIGAFGDGPDRLANLDNLGDPDNLADPDNPDGPPADRLGPLAGLVRACIPDLPHPGA